MVGKRKLGKPPRIIHPNSAEIKYRELLNLILDRIRAAVNAVLIPALPSLANSAQQSRADGWVENTGGLLDDLSIYYGKTAPDYQNAVASISSQVNNWNSVQWRKVMKQTVGVDVFTQSPGLSDRLAIFAQQNKELIKGYTDTAFKNINVTVMNALRQGKRHEEISKELQNVYNITKNRAKLIARDQVAKLNGDLTQMRQQSSGIEIYIWRAMQDERTRKTHAVLDGKYCRWDNPNVYADSPDGPWKPRSLIGGFIGHPGDDYQCRCYAEPYIADIEAILKGENQPAPEPIEVEPEPQRLPSPAPAPVATPAPIPAATPSGISANTFYKLTGAKNEKVAVDTINELINAKVLPAHFVADTPQTIKFRKFTDNKSGQLSFGFRRDANGIPKPYEVEVQLNKSKLGRIEQHSTITHETGHGIDIELGYKHNAKLGYRDDLYFSRSNHPLAKEFRDAYQNSPEFKALKTIRKSKKVADPSNPGKEIDLKELVKTYAGGDVQREIKIMKSYMNFVDHYLPSPEESFARAYTQYSASKLASNSKIWQGYDAQRSITQKDMFSQFAQWTDETFKPIAAVFDKLIQGGFL